MNISISTTSIQYVKGVGPAKAKLFENLGVNTIEELLYLFPNRYEDRRNITPIAQTITGEYQAITGTVVSHKARKSWHTKKHLTEVVIDDGGGRIVCVWFNQPYLDSYFQKGRCVICYGKIDQFKNRLQMVSPDYEILQDEEDKESLSLNRIVPIYPLTRGITQRFLRKIVDYVVAVYGDQLSDELPKDLRAKHKLLPIRESIAQIHFPNDFDDYEQALRRVSFEEFYFFQICVILRRLSITLKDGAVHKILDSDALKFIDGFGFELTAAQKNVIREIRRDMSRRAPMLRLLQGDVGSGKTIVALFGCYMAFMCNRQSAVMAPTEILARQHFANVQKLIDDGVLKGVRAELLVSSLKAKEKDSIVKAIEAGDVDLVIGTHALLSEDVKFNNLSYVVVDEQHKFGVRQRAVLSEKGNNPDILIMTATPIPRTLCMTLYGDLDVSIIDEMPQGRGKVRTKHFSHEEFDKVAAFVKGKLKEGRQAYFVYPLIDESEKLDLKAAEDAYKYFKKEVFKGFRIGLIHGKLKRAETEKIMTAFKNKEIDVLITTTVVEVGVDVANATVMVIEHAERFGLAQLHQLRGRIGRGGHDGYCCLISDPVTEEAQKRLKAIVKTTDGFKIAQHDLEIRGPGRYFGRHQHGLNELKVANPATQIDILKLARDEAIALTEDDPKLSKTKNQPIKCILRERYPTFLRDVEAG